MPKPNNPAAVKRFPTVVLVCLMAAVSCSCPGGFSQFRESAGDGSRYDFDMPFTDAQAGYDTFIAFHLTSTDIGQDSIPAKIAIVSPSGRMALETVSFPVRGMRFAGKSVEYPYRSGVRIARDTGLWHLSITLLDQSLRRDILGVGFRYEVGD